MWCDMKIALWGRYSTLFWEVGRYDAIALEGAKNCGMGGDARFGSA